MDGRPERSNVFWPIAIFENFLDRIKHIKLPIIAGLWPLTSIRNAEFMNNEIPGCHVPDNILKRLAKYENSKEASRLEGIEISRETLDQIKNMINGIQIATPFGRVKSVFDILDGFKFY